MGDFRRLSPVRFESEPVKTEVRDQWVVVTEYNHEGAGPWLVDLCHKTRWDLQDGRLDDRTPVGVSAPSIPGECRMNNRILVSRLNRTQAAVWHLGRGETPELPVEPGYTDVSEASAFLALCGPKVFTIVEKLTALDFMQPDRQAPFLLQGPLSHVGCKIIVLAKKKNGSGAILLTCARGYAEAMVHAILAAGAAYGLRPAGESRFTSWLAPLQD